MDWEATSIETGEWDGQVWTVRRLALKLENETVKGGLEGD